MDGSHLPTTCNDVTGVAHANGDSFLCGFDSCNRCTCVNGQRQQTTTGACTVFPDGGRTDDAGVDDGGRDTLTPPMTCNDLVAGGDSVLSVFAAGPPPDLGQGGTIVDGVYNLTATTIYQSSPTTQQFFDRETIRISGGATRIEYVSASAGAWITETIAPAGASLNPTTICPGPQQSVGPFYTATADQFTLVNGLYVKVFTRVRPPADAGSDAMVSTCTALTAGGALVSSTDQAGPPPDPGMGGTIVDGTYDLTKFTYYNRTPGSGAATDSETIRISGAGTRLEYVSGAYHFSFVISLAPSGALLHDGVVCPADLVNMFVGPSYTATPGQLASIGTGYVKVFTLRP
jgi:hypothetical protein